MNRTSSISSITMISLDFEICSTNVLNSKLFYVLCLYDQYLISAFIAQTYIQISFLKCSYKSICKKYNLFFKYNEILTELRQ